MCPAAMRCDANREVREELLRVFPERNQSGDGRLAGDDDDASAPQQLGVIADPGQPTVGCARRGDETSP